MKREHENVRYERPSGSPDVMHTDDAPRRLDEAKDPAGSQHTAHTAHAELPGGQSRDSLPAHSEVVHFWRERVTDEEPGRFFGDSPEGCSQRARRLRYWNTLHVQHSAARRCCAPIRTVAQARSEVFDPRAGISLPLPALCSASFAHNRCMQHSCQPHDVQSSNPEKVRVLPKDLQDEVFCGNHGTVRLKTRAAGLLHIAASHDASRKATSLRSRPSCLIAAGTLVSHAAPPRLRVTSAIRAARFA